CHARAHGLTIVAWLGGRVCFSWAKTQGCRQGVPLMNDDDRQFLEALQRLRLHLRARAIDSPEGGRLTSATGGRIDFHSHRRYERRDPPRALDWRVFARTGALVAKELVDERSVEFHLFIDNSG